MDTAIAVFESKPDQKLVTINWTLLFHIFIYLRKYNVTIDRRICIWILQRYAVRPRMLRLNKA